MFDAIAVGIVILGTLPIIYMIVSDLRESPKVLRIWHRIADRFEQRKKEKEEKQREELLATLHQHISESIRPTRPPTLVRPYTRSSGVTRTTPSPDSDNRKLIVSRREMLCPVCRATRGWFIYPEYIHETTGRGTYMVHADLNRWIVCEQCESVFDADGAVLCERGTTCITLAGLS